MNIIGQKVSHKAFGDGAITKLNDRYITVEFHDKAREFQYPDIFKNFLVADDYATQEYIKQVLANLKEKENQVKSEQIQSIKRSTEKKKALCANSREAGKRQYFYVFQNKSYLFSQKGKYLWAPIDGSVSHWERMCDVHKGDITFHGVRQRIVAISIATSDYYEALQPKELEDEHLWGKNGYKVDCEYTEIKRPIKPADYINKILELQPAKYAPFNSRGRGNSGYLFFVDYPLAKYLFSILLEHNQYLSGLSEFEELIQP